ncbi:MAG: two-component system sensor histidine kinase PhoQ [Granulosicoccus sp.]|jgi:two-component system sensor histidine kinase PhoQ
MRSITSRLVIGTSIVLTVFVILVGLSVSYSVHQRAETARLDRLQGLIYGILGATDIDNDAMLSVNTLALPDPMLGQSTAGLYAELVGSDGRKLWQSTSTTSWIPSVKVRPIGDWLFETAENENANSLHRLQLATAWEFANGEEFPFIVHVVSEADSLARQLKRFDQTLWASLLGSAIALLVVQLVVLRYTLKPLHNIAEEVADIEHGYRDSLSEHVPEELRSLTMGLNALLGAERERHSQYRHLLDDLAHSLKTPLSVLQNLGKPNQTERDTILEQTSLMRQSIERHTQRATIRSPRYLAPVINVLPVIERTCSTLNKLYESQTVQFNLEGVNSEFTVRMDEADLFEVIGNILENACKYGSQTIWVSTDTKSNTLIVEDDGPGFPDIDLNQLAQRGVRADSQTQGSGMGLAAVQQLMGAHGGQLIPSHRSQGGAHIALVFLQ